MYKTLDKRAILNECIAKQQLLINNFEERIASINNDIYNKLEIPSQTEDRNYNKQEIQSALINQLTIAKQELFILESLNIDGRCDMVEPGAVVDTGKMIFFIVGSGEKVSVEDREVFCISTSAPIYGSMSGLKKDDRFEFNGIKYIINEVY